ncbi:chemotaxis protein CheA [Pseudoalteromonas denitrificans]|uniref:Chemotaxis protein CheA n=1 Tax=Pseudoalteromonas denitrificans DSM 6059 TaxID=1123010 RepID=A0A1I1RNM1_9GAMM|nr:chemotaxis protein CheA [Pseudoalteromonas denitrificans]SFD35949.1 two-component system, chemotaxis family, sensor kinase CheA [Pseudoalteromonas denitrificans DSM 6059]
MSIDLSQFFEVFFEESFEGLDAMEAELLNLEPGDLDSETINTIFRAAHSIKGGSGTFGFNSVADFTHVLETLLDQIRNGERALETNHVNLLLKAVDCLRAMLGALQSEQEPDLTESNTLKAEFETILNIPHTAEPAESQAVNTKSLDTFQVDFKPLHHLFKTGNEPLYLISELTDLGECSVTSDLSDLPDIHDMQPDECYLAWSFFVETREDENKIKEIFEWVEDDAKIEVTLCGGLFSDEPESEQPVEQEAEVSETTTSAQITPNDEVKEQTVKKPPAKANTESTSIRVGIDKVDSLINMVGELVITQAMLTQLGEGDMNENKQMALKEGLAQLAHNTRDMQESVMRIRMMPISFVFSRFPRLVRDISQKLGKEVELKLIGETTELDKTVMEKISDPMVHLVRNSLDHGLETPEHRLEAGKKEAGIVTLNAFHQGGNIVIEIMDDGNGLNTDKIKSKAIEKGLINENDNLSDDEINELIFMPGFSTADAVSDLSGRGVGMDVVKRNIHALNGSIDVTSERGIGSTFTIRLPLTLAILDGQLVTLGKHTYIIPLISIVESLQLDLKQVNCVGGGVDVLRLRDEYIPILRLFQIFNHTGAIEELDKGLLVIVESDNQKVGLLVDDLLAQQQVVIKSLEANYQKVDGVSGATILGDGRVSLIVDISGLIKLAGLKKAGSQKLAIDNAMFEMS